jgi:uracil-DNA glycosylase family 4
MSTSPLRAFVEKIRSEQGLSDEVPNFDPLNGNENAKFLFVLEAPGAKAVKSGFISFDNPDQTAKNFREQLEEAGIKRSEIILWNVVPWYLGNSGKTKIRAAQSRDISKCLDYLGELVSLLKKLECIVLVGSAARKAHVYLSHETKLRILSCHHPSPKVKNFSPATAKENVAVFRAFGSKRLTKQA